MTSQDYSKRYGASQFLAKHFMEEKVDSYRLNARLTNDILKRKTDFKSLCFIVLES